MTKQPMAWIYHADKKPKKIRQGDEIPEGWADTPAAFHDRDEGEQGERTDDAGEPGGVVPMSEAGDEQDESSGERPASDEQTALLEVFHNSPESMDKDDLIKLGELFGLGYNRRYSESTMIEGIAEATDGDHQAAN